MLSKQLFDRSFNSLCNAFFPIVFSVTVSDIRVSWIQILHSRQHVKSFAVLLADGLLVLIHGKSRWSLRVSEAAANRSARENGGP